MKTRTAKTITPKRPTTTAKQAAPKKTPKLPKPNHTQVVWKGL